MFATRARRSAAFLLYGSVQFVVLVAVAMELYPSYSFTRHFLSDLGATRTWYGEPNQAAAVVFAFAVVILGTGMIVFAAAWRDYAFARGRAAAAGTLSQICGTLSGLAFIGVGFAPVNVALDVHNVLVVIAFALLLVFAGAMTLVWSKNGAPRGVIVAGAAYLLVLVGFFASATWAFMTDLFANIRVLIVGQKIAVSASMAYVVYVTMVIRRRS